MRRTADQGPQRLFFSGIGGSGLSALAAFMADKGHSVSGSDRAFDAGGFHPARAPLEQLGIILRPQDGSGIDSSLDLAVFSTAIEADNPDLRRARALDIPIRMRPQFLADIALSHRTLAVAGTSGKSTTSGLTAFIMRRLGLSPSFIGGGRVKAFRDAAHPGNEIAGTSDILVIEACESDGTIVNYRPRLSVILNLALDHFSVEETADLFATLARNTSGPVIINGDDPLLRMSGIRHDASFSVEGPSRYKAEEIVTGDLGCSFTVNGQAYTLGLPGLYNIYNALASVAVLSELGIPSRDIASVMPEFTGLERRFDVHLRDGRSLVIDDYAHNPHKITSFMGLMRAASDSVCYVFQPHGFGPTMLMREGYVRAFVQGLRPGDHLILLPIYYAGGTASRTISSEDLAGEIRASGRSAEAVGRRDDVFSRLDRWRSYAVLGARDESLADLARDIAAALRTPT